MAAVGGRLGVVGTLVIEVAGEVVEEAEDHEGEDLGQAEAVEEVAEEAETQILQDLEDLEGEARDHDTRSFGKRIQKCVVWSGLSRGSDCKINKMI